MRLALRLFHSKISLYLSAIIEVCLFNQNKVQIMIILNHTCGPQSHRLRCVLALHIAHCIFFIITKWIKWLVMIDCIHYSLFKMIIIICVWLKLLQKMWKMWMRVCNIWFHLQANCPSSLAVLIKFYIIQIIIRCICSLWQ